MKNTHAKAKIPPPPGLDEGYDAVIAYHKKYSIDELLKAGYLEEASAEEQRNLEVCATYQLLRERGLNLQFSAKDCELLSLLAARDNAPVEHLAKRWITQRLRQERNAGRNGALGLRQRDR